MIKCLSFIKEAEARVAIGTIITKFSVEVVLTPEKKKGEMFGKISIIIFSTILNVVL